MDWRDLRIALALQRHPSHLEAGRALGVDATTVGRRIAALEADLGATLFAHTPQGWRATATGERVLQHAARMADEARAIQRTIELAGERVVGTVRLTTLDEVATWLLVPRLPELRAEHPDLRIDLVCTDQVLDLVAGRADVAVRLMRPEEEGVRVRRLGAVPFGAYGVPRWLEAGDEPDLVVLGRTERPLAEVRWLLDRFPRGRIVVRTNSIPACYDAVRAGLGIGAMVATVGEASKLTRFDDGVDAPARSVWRVVPEALADAAPVRAVVAWLDRIGEALPAR